MYLQDCRGGTFIPQATLGQIAGVLRERFIDHPDPTTTRRHSEHLPPCAKWPPLDRRPHRSE